MAVFKCKVCGGSLDVKPGDLIAECEYCGTKQTLPKLDNDQKINLYERANQFRRNNEYDKAMGLYEQILHDDITDAETYWSIVLCKYGIEYVEDPATRKWLPTVNRVQFTPVVADTDYKAALQYANEDQRQIYEDEAKKIDSIQKDILDIAEKEDPFDIFICYKEADDKGRRTPDSVLANDLYYLLTDEGYKVFFSRITLEDKLGTAYEPYIFNALNSSKIMLVLGTKPEYFNAVWVKNEWSRFMKLLEQDRTRMLIPCYRDMDPYDLPEEFSHLQAQDMSRLGFSQDLLRGIKKILDPSIPNESISIKSSDEDDKKTIDLSVKKLFLALEEEDWSSAEEYCEKILDIDPLNARAYLGKLMIDMKVPYPSSLKDSKTDFEENINYKRAVRYADDDLKKRLKEYNSEVKNCIANADYEEYYQKACAEMKLAYTEEHWYNLADDFAHISDYKDSNKLREQCLDSADSLRVNRLFDEADELQNDNTKQSLEQAVKKYELIEDEKDVGARIQECKEKLNEIYNQEAIDLQRENRLGLLRRTVCMQLGTILILISLIIELSGNDASAPYITGLLLLFFGSFVLFSPKARTAEKLVGVLASIISVLLGFPMYSINEENGSALFVIAFLALLMVVISCVINRKGKKGQQKNSKYLFEDLEDGETIPKITPVKPPIASSNVTNQNYKQLQNMFSNNGFSNIVLSPIKDVKYGILTKEGSVESITIDGDKSFNKRKSYNPNVPVIITYHTKKSKIPIEYHNP